MQSIYDLVATDFTAVNDLILSKLHSEVDLVEDISQHLVTSGGKRIRPLVTLLVAGALGNNGNSKQIELATAIEFLHTATLLHDDVVDMSILRRGKPTANANWGNASSVLVGDFVYSRAFQIIVSIGILPVMAVLSDTTAKIAEGEVSQLTEIGNTELDEQGYFNVIQNKTAQLFAGACESSGIVAGVDSKTIKLLGNYGLHLGLAFQIIDDYLDYAGNAEELGKNVGDDLAEGKLTLPLIQALRASATTDPHSHQTLLDIIHEKDLNRINEVIDIVHQTGAMRYTLDCATQQINLCQQAIQPLNDSDYKKALLQLTEFVIERAH